MYEQGSSLRIAKNVLRFGERGIREDLEGTEGMTECGARTRDRRGMALPVHSPSSLFSLSSSHSTNEAFAAIYPPILSFSPYPSMDTYDSTSPSPSSPRSSPFPTTVVSTVTSLSSVPEPRRMRSVRQEDATSRSGSPSMASRHAHRLFHMLVGAGERQSRKDREQAAGQMRGSNMGR